MARAAPTPPSAPADDPKYFIPFYDTRLGKAFGDPKKYARVYAHAYEAGEYRRGSYDVASFTPGYLHPEVYPSPSYAQAATSSGSGGKGKSKAGKLPSPELVASTTAPPVEKGPPSLPGRVRYGADGAPKNAGPRPFSPPRPTQRPGAWCLFRHSLPLSPLRPPPHPYPRRVPVKNRW